ncbi:hypothetical protein D6810_01150 [Candidatus Dojkabacteria bacterium]|uniref:Uncharacterized protein n=1 Tax=Candidatus Dojkabacteria bacterium TaxID=2099670 RepID=A0A3M0Z5G5_9BACT|nr:MAG: hypothetical protein D6810_01150 [Candidatus Dojkabacteria bacterium]
MSTGITKHAEAIKLEFGENSINYVELL